MPLQPDDLTPYLGLRARLSQIWINRWTVLLLLILVRVLLAASGLQADMDSAKTEALSACTAVESMGSSMASMPHYLSQGVNELTATGVEHAVDGLVSMLLLTVTGVEEMILFFIKMMYQTYLCLFTLVVRGSVEVAVEGLEKAADFLNTTVSTVGQEIATVADDFEATLNKFINDINSAASLFGADGTVPTLNINSSIEKLENLTLPSSIYDDLDKLNSSIPSFDEVSNFTQTIIRTPFEEVKKLINESLGNYTFDRSVLPIPAKEQLTFCGDNDGINSFFNGVADLVFTARKIFIAVLAIAAVLACIPMAWQEIRRWRSMKDRSQLVRKEAHDPMDVVYIVSRPYTAAAGIKAASRFSNSRRQILVRWAIAYATTPQALLVLCLGITGLVACLCQYLLLRAIQTSVPELTDQVEQFADKVVDALQNASATWANETNGVIENMNNDLNENVFGWVNTSTTALNNTLNTFVDKTTDLLNDTFGGTPLYGPLTDLFQCLLGFKIQGIQTALTWASDNAHIDFPLLPNDTLSLGAAASISNTSDPSDSFLASAGNQTSNQISEVIAKVIQKVQEGIWTETKIAAALFLIWVFVALIGILRAVISSWRREKNRGEGRGAPPPINPLSPVDGFIDVPLSAVPANPQPAPRYEARAITTDTIYEDEKLGFAGERQYGSALNVNGAPDLRGSSYVEYGMEKR